MRADDFRIGQRVRLSEKYLARHKPRASTFGTVVGYGHAAKTPNGIRVKRDGSNYAETWGASFWEPVE